MTCMASPDAPDAIARSWLATMERRAAAFRSIVAAGTVTGYGDAGRSFGLPFGLPYLLIEVQATTPDHACGPDCACWRGRQPGIAETSPLEEQCEPTTC